MAMNTRQLTQGLLPTIEYEQVHTYKSFRQFPELRQSVQAIQDIRFKSGASATMKHSRSLPRKKSYSSVHHLQELSKSSLTEASSVMDDFRRILVENRLRMASTIRVASPKSNKRLEKQRSLSMQSSTQLTGNSLVIPGKQNDFEDSLQSIDASSSKAHNIDPLTRANEKLKMIAISFDAQSANSHLDGFQGSKLTKEELTTQLRRCINVHLRPTELDALFSSMDRDDSAHIDGVEFVRYFFKLGNEARTAQQHETRERQLKRAQRRAMEKDREIDRIRLWEANQIVQHTEEDTASAWRKLEAISLRYEPSKEIDAMMLRKIAGYLTPFDFRLKLESMSKLLFAQQPFTHSECAALIAEYSRNDDQAEMSKDGGKKDERCVDGYLFVTQFIHLTQRAWRTHKEKREPLKRRRERINAMGQHTDILPAILGR